MPAKQKWESQQSQRTTSGFTRFRPRNVRLNLVFTASGSLPVSAVAGALLGFNFLGDALRDQLDPRTRLEMGL